MNWNQRRENKNEKLSKVERHGKQIAAGKIVDVFEQILAPGDRVILEGDNQKQARFLAQALGMVDVRRVHDLAMVIPSIEDQNQINLFERGIATSVDFSFAGPQSRALVELINQGKITVNNIHTYIELYGRLFVDLIPDVALITAAQADAAGNLYLAQNTEETPILVEATAVKSGIVVAQVNEVVDRVPRIDIPAEQVDLIVKVPEAEKPFPLFTRDPQKITEDQIMAGMLAIKGIYGKYQVKTLNHGIGYNTAAIELLLPTFGEQLGLKGKIATNWVNKSTPTLIPAIEAGWVKSIYCFGGEAGMEKYIQQRPDIFAVDHCQNLKSNRVYAQIAGQYAIDMFVGATLQTDADGNASTITANRLSGFGGAPNMGSDPHGRRHLTDSYRQIEDSHKQGRKLVVQLTTSRRWNHEPVFVDQLDAWKLKERLAVDPIMIYSEDTTHIVSENGIANLYKTDSPTERRQAIAAIAGDTAVGQKCSEKERQVLRERGIVQAPQDLGIHRREATRDLLAAKSIDELVKISHGLYRPVKK